MFAFTESVTIEAPPAVVWDRLRDLEDWWPASNPEHESLERLDDRGIEPGARLRIREKIAGVPGEAIGEITRVEPGTAVTWEAPAARYRWFGITFTIGEGVTWRIAEDEPSGSGRTRLSARVWATFPHGVTGRVLEKLFTYALNGVERDREHTRCELRYLKQELDGH